MVYEMNIGIIYVVPAANGPHVTTDKSPAGNYKALCRWHAAVGHTGHMMSHHTDNMFVFSGISRITAKSQIPTLLKAYETLYHDRARKKQLTSFFSTTESVPLAAMRHKPWNGN